MTDNRRFMLDTNVLLSACFIAGSEQRALEALLRAGVSTVIDDWIEGEAHRVLRAIRSRLALPYDPSELLTAFVAKAKILRLPPAAPPDGGTINRADRWVAAASTAYGATLLTGDTDLLMQCRTDGIAASSPMQVLDEFGEPPSLSIGFGVPVENGPTEEVGVVFARVLSGGWGGAAQRFTVCHLPHAFCVEYDGAAKARLMQLGAKSVRAAAVVGSQQVWTVCGTWRSARDLQTGELAIYAAPAEGQALKQSSLTLQRRAGLIVPRKDLRLGSKADGSDYWNGHLQSLTMAGAFLSFRKFKNVVALGPHAPEPKSGFELELALQQLSNR